MSEEDGMRFSPERTEELRKAFLDGPMMGYMRELFAALPQVQSCVLCLAQYWNDEAGDAVHVAKYVSEFRDPDMDAFYEWSKKYFDEDHYAVNTQVPNPLTPNIGEVDVWSWERKAFKDWYTNPMNCWDDNYDAVTLFAAYVEDGGSQEEPEHENYNPFCIYQRGAEGKITWKYMIQKPRPYADGAWPEFADIDFYHDAKGNRDPEKGGMMKAIKRYQALEGTMEAASKGASMARTEPGKQAQS